MTDEQRAEDGLILVKDYEGLVKIYRDDDEGGSSRLGQVGCIKVDVKALAEKYAKDGLGVFCCAFSLRDFQNKGDQK